MTKEKSQEQEEEALYTCAECKLQYRDKEWAEKCEAWCKETSSCNLDIIKHAIAKEEK